MPDLRLSVKLTSIEMNTRYFRYGMEENWEEIKAILEKYGIEISLYKISLNSDNYTTSAKDNVLREESSIYYNGQIVAKVSEHGDKFEKKAKMVVYDCISKYFNT